MTLRAWQQPVFRRHMAVSDKTRHQLRQFVVPYWFGGDFYDTFFSAIERPDISMVRVSQRFFARSLSHIVPSSGTRAAPSFYAVERLLS